LCTDFYDEERNKLLEIVSEIEGIYAGRMYLGLSEVAMIVGVSTKTLKRHAEAGNITFSLRGFGRKKPRRSFTVRDVARFCLRVSRNVTASDLTRRRSRRRRGQPID
jgi:hypothetical protein